MNQKILIVDDEPKMCRTLEILLMENGSYEIISAYNAREALERFSKDIDLVITDLAMEGMDGIGLLKNIKALNPDTQVILMTAYSSVKSAIEALKSGACEYLVKPFDNDEFLAVVDRALEVNRLKREVRYLKEDLGDRLSYRNIVGKSPLLQEVFYLMEKAQHSDSTVLITGESGTGKELVARAIHFTGQRSSGPFIPINCTALPETLLESELFGFERGAFTGALKTKIGKFERAHRGTAFLDEVGEMSPTLQVKLLRFLQEKEFERVGGTSPIRVNARIIAATNTNLSRAIAAGKFREDLYYRLNVILINLPPLRQRREDISMLIDHFLAHKAEKLGIEKKTLSPDARDILLRYDFPGNVRELENLIERALITSSGSVMTPADIPLERLVAGSDPSDTMRSADAGTRPPTGGGPDAISRGDSPDGLLNILGIGLRGGWEKLHHIMTSLEYHLIRRAMEEWRTSSNSEIASLLGTTRRKLELRMKQGGLEKDKKK